MQPQQRRLSSISTGQSSAGLEGLRVELELELLSGWMLSSCFHFSTLTCIAALAAASC